MQAVPVKITDVQGPSTNKPIKISDLPAPYNPQLTTVLLPEYLVRLGLNHNPWKPTFDEFEVLQELHDVIFFGASHIIDKKSSLYGLVRNSMVPPYFS